MDDTKKILSSLLVSSPMILSVNQLNDDHKEMIGYDIPYEELGFTNLLDFLNDIPDVLRVNGNSLTSEVTLVISEKVSHVKELVVKQKKRKGQYGLHSSQRHYKQAPREPKQKVDLVSPTSAVPDDDYKAESSNKKSHVAPALLTLDWKYYAQMFPIDAVGPGVVIERDFVRQREIESPIFPVVVAQIFDPSKFWLFRDDGRLEILMVEMQKFYWTNKHRYCIPEQFLETGLYCVAVVLEEFHRCVIVKMLPELNFVHVFYIDYGSLGIVPKKQLWFLTTDFTRLPAQAIRARLANICPPRECAMWTSEARGRFNQLADMKHLVARITKVSKEQEIIEVHVENLIYGPGKSIGSILVDEGHAVYDIQIRRLNMKDLNCTDRVESEHLKPQFDEIEKWTTPSVDEIALFSDEDLNMKHHSQYLEKLDEEYEWDLSYPECGYYLDVVKGLRLKSLRSSLPHASFLDDGLASASSSVQNAYSSSENPESEFW